MENIKNKILRFLKEEQINVVCFEEKEFDIVELIIEVEDENIPKWSYFVNRLRETINEVKVLNLQNIYKFIFNDIGDERLLNDTLDEFYNVLEKKYFKVNPRIGTFSLLVKPTHRCNLDCKYCYDKPFRDAIPEDMSMETLDRIVKLLSEYARHVQFIWHGGEPTMVGTEWYERAYNEVFSKYPMISWTFQMMSNGVKLDQEWLELFDKYNINVGVSFNSIYQEKLRCSSQLSDTKEHDKEISQHIEDVLKMSVERKKPIGVIDVITKRNFMHMKDIYEYYKNLKISCCQNTYFHTPQTEKNDLEYSPKEYVKEFLEFFKYWLYDKDGLDERTASGVLKHVIGNRQVTCTNTDCRKMWIGVNPLGVIYPCDRYYTDKYKMGNIYDFDSIEEIFESEKYKGYSKEIQKRFDIHCKECGYWFACRGGCNGSAIESTGSCEGVEENYCEAFKQNFNGVYEILRDVDVIRDKDINPVARHIMLNSNFYSIKEIKRYLSEMEVEFELEYDPQNLLECSEYKIFRGINYIKDECRPNDYHTDVIHSFDEEVITLNENTRKKDLFEFLSKIKKTRLVRK